MKVLKQTISLILVVCLLMGAITTLVGCSETTIIDNETTRLVLATTELDGVFNPFFSSSATDGTIVSMTQLGMLSSDKDGKVSYGEDEACIVLDYQAQYILPDGTEVDEIDADTEVAYTRYRFVLKNDIKFSDGSPLTMKDVLFNLYVYLDPAYYGSSTIYSTEIVGLQEYRTQTTNKSEQEDFEAGFISLANDRVLRLAETLDEIYEANKKNSLSEDEMLYALTEKMNEYSELDEGYATLVDDFALMKTKFKEMLQQYYNSARGTAEDTVYTDKNGKKVTLTTDTEAFLYYVGLINWDDKNKKFDYSLGEGSKDWTEQQVLDNIFNSYYPNKSLDILYNYWGVANDLVTYFTYLEKQKHFENITDRIENVSGIRYANRTEAVTVNGVNYIVPTLDANGAVTNDTNEILEITIEKVDPKAIWNFAFTVAPMYYYSTYDVYKDFDYETNFGVQFGSIEFMDNVVKNPDKIGVPVGAGPYKATTRSGDSTNVTAGTFKAGNVVYFERNEHFLFDVKIKYVNYQVVPTNLMLESLYSGDVHFVEPSCKQENIDSLNEKRDEGFAGVPIQTNGYGYIGINAEKVVNIDVRRAIMHAINTQYAVDYYFGYSDPITRPMTKASWAYPHAADEEGQYYKFDDTGAISEQLVIGAGYKKNSEGIYQKGDDVLEYTFTIAGDTTDHPAYQSLKRAAEILNKHGFKITVKTDINALKKLNDGQLAVWAAAWGAGVDPDMYQVYHIDSTAGSTSNWGYRAIKANNGGKYDVELDLVQDLSDIIDKARSTLDPDRRTELYAQALDIVMELAVELPTYQRSDLFAYNSNIIDVNSLTPSSERSPYNGLLNRIWEVSLNETEGAGANGAQNNDGWIIAIIIIAVLLVAGGACVGVYFVLQNKKKAATVAVDTASADNTTNTDESEENKAEDSDTPQEENSDNSEKTED